MTAVHGYSELEGEAGIAVVRDDLKQLPLKEFWQTGGKLAGAKGRGGVGCFRLRDGLELVCRDYRRGGIIGWILRNTFFDPRRPERELRILEELSRAGVPTVEPIAALSRPTLLGHRLRLVTQLFSGGLTLPDFIAAHPEQRAAAVRGVGSLVARAFDCGLWHRDLHPDNILARAGAEGPELRLIDLDRAELRADLSDEDRDRMLIRMARYLPRHADQLPVAIHASEYLRFLAGMGLDKKARRETLQRLLPRYRWELARRGLGPPVPKPI
ncbi:MAG: lipopolysaccharide kinase InaA family protein [Planctomycetota bacterium]